MTRDRRSGQRGSALVLVLAIAGIALVRVAGNDRVAAGQLGIEDRALTCAEAGLQYARRYFGTRYATSHGWNDYLNGTVAGYRYDPDHFAGETRNVSAKPADTKGSMSGSTTVDFWVSIRDDDDERPLGAADDRTPDNNEVIVIRSECVNPAYPVTRGGQPAATVVESTLANIQASSGYGVTGPANAPDIVGRR